MPNYLKFFQTKPSKELEISPFSYFQPFIEAIIKANEQQKKSDDNKKNITDSNKNTSNDVMPKSSNNYVIHYNGQYIQPDSVSPGGTRHYFSINLKGV